MTERYYRAKKKDDGLYLICAREFGEQLWVVTTTRKLHACALDGTAIQPGATAFRPMTNGKNRMDRISQTAIERLAEMR